MKDEHSDDETIRRPSRPLKRDAGRLARAAAGLTAVELFRAAVRRLVGALWD